jgi:hypothetical protein
MAQQVTEPHHEGQHSAASEDYFLEFLPKNDNIKNRSKDRHALFERK